MGSIGATLKKEREKRGLSLAEVHEATKISLHSLSELEEEHFDSFPNKVYVRAFLRDYANYLGLDSGVLLIQYEEAWGRLVNEPEPQPRRSFVKVTLLSIVILALAAGGGYYYLGDQIPSLKVLQKQATKHAGVAPTTPKPTQPAKTPMVTSPIPPKPAVLPIASFRVSLYARQNSWIKIWLDGKRAYEGILATGDIGEWEAKDSIRLRTGNAGGLQVKVNGQPQQALGGMGQIADRFWRKSDLPTQ